MSDDNGVMLAQAMPPSPFNTMGGVTAGAEGKEGSFATYIDPPPQGRAFNGTLGDGTICINSTVCNNKPSDVLLPYLQRPDSPEDYFYLQGRYVTIPLSAPLRSYNNFRVDVTNKLFGYINTYFHATRTLSRADELIFKDGGEEKTKTGNRISILLDNPYIGCNAGYARVDKMILVGSCGNQATGNSISLSYDGTVVSHESGHAVLARLNEDVGASPQDIEGAALHEAFADLMVALYTGRPTIGEDAARFSGNAELQRIGYIRSVNNNEVLKDATPEEPHARSLVYSGYFWDIVKFLVKKGVPFKDARTAVEMLILEHALYYSPKELEPEDVVRSSLKALERLSGDQGFQRLLGDKVRKNEFFMELIQNGIRRGIVRMKEYTTYPTNLLQDAWLPIGEPAEDEDVRYPGTKVPVGKGVVIARHRQFQKVPSGPLKGTWVLVEGCGWTEMFVDGAKRVIARHTPKKKIDGTVNYTPADAAILIRSQKIKDAVARLNLPKPLEEYVTTRILVAMQETFWFNTATPVIPHGRDDIHYKFTIGPAYVYVSAKDGSVSVGKTIFY